MTLTQGTCTINYFAQNNLSYLKNRISSKKKAKNSNLRMSSDNSVLGVEITNRCKTSIFEDRDSSIDPTKMRFSSVYKLISHRSHKGQQ